MYRFQLLFVCLLIGFVSFSQVTIKLLNIPSNTPQPVNIYVAGTMNNWDPGNPEYKLISDSSGSFSIKFYPALGTVKFKFTQGSWATVEGTQQGGFIPDRIIAYTGQPTTVALSIAGWEGMGNATSTASPQVSILSDAFDMPQLNRKRRLWLYLPKDYQNGQKEYPVLYMHDGQNLFDRNTSFSGEWRVDESLDSMIVAGDYGCIVVGIDNGGSNRLNEYSPWVNTQYGGGQGDEYVDFLVKTLKPYIDSNYRTLKDADNTALLGSSMGGLISMYAGIKYPEVFGKIGALSSSFWFSDKSYQQVNDTGAKSTSYFYLIAGAKEGGNQVGDMNKMVTTLKSNGSSDLNIVGLSHADGQHSEWYWAREFPKAYKWLFEKKTSGINNINEETFKIWQSSNSLNISCESDVNGKVLNVYNASGQIIITDIIRDNSIQLVKDMSSGFYIVHIGSQNKGVKVFLNIQ